MATAGEKDWMNVRLAIAAALIIGSFIFYVGYWFAMWRREGKKSHIYMNELAAKYYLYGVGALMSLNYVQSGIFQTVLIYLVMIGLTLLVGAALLPDTVDEKKRTSLFIVYYTLLLTWYMGIMIDFYVTYDD